MKSRVSRILAVGLVASLLLPHLAEAVQASFPVPASAPHFPNLPLFGVQTLNPLAAFFPRSEEELNANDTIEVTQQIRPSSQPRRSFTWISALRFALNFLPAAFGMPVMMVFDDSDETDAPVDLDKKVESALKFMDVMIHDMNHNVGAIHGTYLSIKADPENLLDDEVAKALSEVDALSAALLGRLRHIRLQSQVEQQTLLMKALVFEFPQLMHGIREPLEIIQRSHQVRTELFRNLRRGVGLMEDTFMVSQGRPRKREVPLNDVIHDMVAQARALVLTENTIQETYLLEAPQVWANRGLLSKAVLNLLVNALHAVGERDNGIIRVTTQPSPSEEGMFQVIVEDNGYGISANALSRIFEKGYTTKPVGVGTGLGLYIVRSILNGIGGDVRAESAGAGQGSRFIIELPAKGFHIQRKATEPSQSTSQPRVLVVDDNPALCDMIRTYFESQGFEVVEAADGLPAIEKFQPGTLEIAFVDGMLPVVQGIEVVRHIQRVEPDLPIVFTSDYSVANEELEKEFPSDQYPLIELARSKMPEDLKPRMDRLVQLRQKLKGNPGPRTPRLALFATVFAVALTLQNVLLISAVVLGLIAWGLYRVWMLLQDLREPREARVEKWKRALQYQIDQARDPRALWVRLEYLLASLIQAKGAIKDFDEDEERDKTFLHVPTGPLPDDEDLPEIGLYLQAALKWKAGFEEAVGSIAPFIVMLSSFVEEGASYMQVVKRSRLLIGGDNDALLMGDFTDSVALVRHIRGNGMHFEKKHAFDHELLIEVARDFIPRLLALSPERWNAFVPVRPGHDAEQLRFGDVMLWGLAHMLDLRIQDPSVVGKFGSGHAVRVHKSVRQIRQSMLTFLERTLRDLPEVDAQGHPTGTFLDSARLYSLIGQATKTDQEWEALGFDPPGLGVDYDPGTMQQRMYAILKSHNRPLRDAVFNVVLQNQKHRLGMVLSYFGEGSASIRKEYVAKYGTDSNLLLKTTVSRLQKLQDPQNHTAVMLRSALFPMIFGLGVSLQSPFWVTVGLAGLLGLGLVSWVQYLYPNRVSRLIRAAA